MVIQKLVLENPGGADKKHLKEAVESFLYELVKNGQVWESQWVLAWEGDTLMGYIKTPAVEAVMPQHHSQSVTSLQREVEEIAEAPIKWVEIENHNSQDVEWHQEEYLYLFTHCFDDSSPLCAGSNGKPIPLYSLELGSKLTHELVNWMTTYKTLDSLWLNSGPLEMDAYKQIAGIKSQFYKDTKTLQLQLEDALSKPVFYYLLRYWGRSDNEFDRLCPSCGGQWLIDESIDTDLFFKFNFKCDDCRLVAHIADSYDDERKARTGEYQQRS
ncbi:DUF2310 family Zn-ribbon-containing protein [Pleionea sp. CnH1-48]|uniref:DUF2310 family Zn-ribbon-containing protein n=1 Tax=Pleionea sp. CnH1-48 TaxID=2954494 RepID=UPI002097A42A|nr:DUF2310 family Zn-ribbon-containing protein [Pleionea sp. CnH1-48]MCO7224189.1 Zn-ribbon-containing protein [Pleionea sp. CnH1-48]